MRPTARHEGTFSSARLRPQMGQARNQRRKHAAIVGGLRHDMGLALCCGLHRAAVRPRDGALRRSAAARPRCGGACLHSVCGRVDRAEGPAGRCRDRSLCGDRGPGGRNDRRALWARSEDSGLLLAIAYSGLFLNLFNLLPISPLDGGRVTAVLGPKVWFLGVPILLALLFYRPSPMLIIVAILALSQLVKAWRYDPQAPE